MRKKKIKVFEKNYDGYRAFFKFSDLPSDLESEDMINFEKNDAYYGSDSSWDAHSTLTIYREVPMTEEDLREEKEFLDRKKEESRKKRFEDFLRLKKEFEPEIGV